MLVYKGSSQGKTRNTSTSTEANTSMDLNGFIQNDRVFDNVNCFNGLRKSELNTLVSTTIFALPIYNIVKAYSSNSGYGAQICEAYVDDINLSVPSHITMWNSKYAVSSQQFNFVSQFATFPYLTFNRTNGDINFVIPEYRITANPGDSVLVSKTDPIYYLYGVN